MNPSTRKLLQIQIEDAIASDETFTLLMGDKVEPRKEFITMVVLAVGNIPLLYFLNPSWYDTIMHTIAGQIMLTITGIVIFISAACVIKLTKPIEYRT